MTEEEARAWIIQADVSRETFERLDQLADLVREEAGRQNLVSRSTLDQLWARHIVDSVQLLALAPAGRWLDIGSGAGFPGLVIAAASERLVTLAEPRALRADFLRRAAASLGIEQRVIVHAGKVETLPVGHLFEIISARAVAPATDLFWMSAAVANHATVWLLPKGRTAAGELATARETWQGEFRLVPSVTDPAAAIIVARDIRPRTRS